MSTSQRVLVIVTQRLGDVLLSTPLIRSLRRAWPKAHIAALVFADTATALASNADVDAVLTVARRLPFAAHLRMLAQLWRRYDIAFSTGVGDRPTLYAWIAGKRRFGIVAQGAKHWWKRLVLNGWIALDDRDTHTVAMNLRLADLAGVPRSQEVVATWSAQDAAHVRETISVSAYAVLHVQPKFAYKAWHAAGWVALGRWLDASGLRIVLSGSDDPRELDVIRQLVPQLPNGTVSVAGAFTLSQTAYLISQARLFVGPDTITTHMAAALGTPTIALFGPSNPVKWGPWPRGVLADRSPFAMRGSQHVGNVVLIQGEGSCVPCMQEGCERHINSHSTCLDELSPQTVIDAARRLLQSAPRVALPE